MRSSELRRAGERASESKLSEIDVFPVKSTKRIEDLFLVYRQFLKILPKSIKSGTSIIEMMVTGV